MSRLRSGAWSSKGRRRDSPRINGAITGLAVASSWLSQPLLQLAHTILTVVLNGFEDHCRGTVFNGPAWWIDGPRSRPIWVNQSGRTCSRLRSDVDPQKTHWRANSLPPLTRTDEHRRMHPTYVLAALQPRCRMLNSSRGRPMLPRPRPPLPRFR